MGLAFLKLWQARKVFPQEGQKPRTKKQLEDYKEKEQAVKRLLQLALEVRSGNHPYLMFPNLYLVIHKILTKFMIPKFIIVESQCSQRTRRKPNHDYLTIRQIVINIVRILSTV